MLDRDLYFDGIFLITSPNGICLKISCVWKIENSSQFYIMFSWPKFKIIALKYHIWKTNTNSYMITFYKNIQLPSEALALLLLWLTLDTRMLSCSIKYLIFLAEFSLGFILLACCSYLCQQSCSRVASELHGYPKILAPMHLWFSISRRPHCAVWGWCVAQLGTRHEWEAVHRACLQPRNLPLGVCRCKPLRCSEVKQQTQCPLPSCLMQVIVKNVFSL